MSISDAQFSSAQFDTFTVAVRCSLVELWVIVRLESTNRPHPSGAASPLAPLNLSEARPHYLRRPHQQPWESYLSQNHKQKVYCVNSKWARQTTNPYEHKLDKGYTFSLLLFESYWISIPYFPSKLLHYANILFTQSVVILMRPNSDLVGPESEARLKVVGRAKVGPICALTP